MASTRHLTLEEKGAYSELLDHHFLHGSIPTDMKRIGAILGVSTQKARKTWASLAKFFYEKDGAFFQKRMVKELTKAAEISEKRANAARAKWDANAHANAHANADNNSQLTINNKDITPLVRTATRFDEWWDAYALKKNRKKALAIWKRRKLDSMADELIADAMKRHEHDDDWKRGFQPHPTTYLNGDRWNDELTTSRPGTDRQTTRETDLQRAERKIREADARDRLA
jgi:uncharacterized protein YdaU (DUF1376 family)